MALTLVTDAAAPVVTDTECKLFARIDTSDDDVLVTAINGTATNVISKEMAKSFVNTTWLLTLDEFPHNEVLATGQQFFQICKTPLVSVTEVLFFDVDGVQQTLAADQYIVDTVSEPARVVEAPEVSWPSTQNRINAVSVEFVAGYGVNASFVPEEFKNIVKIYFTHLYEHRDAAHDKTWKEIPKHIQYMIDLLKVSVFG